MTPKSLPSSTAGLLLLAGLTAQAAAQTPKPEVHPDFQQIIPRGRMASVDEPQFAGAKDAEIADDAWILGVEIDGQARAYSLNLLNSHEVVNDQIGNQRFAAVW